MDIFWWHVGRIVLLLGNAYFISRTWDQGWSNCQQRGVFLDLDFGREHLLCYTRRHDLVTVCAESR